MNCYVLRVVGESIKIYNIKISNQKKKKTCDKCVETEGVVDIGL